MKESENDSVSISTLKALLDNAPEGILLLSKDHKILAFNSIFKDIATKYYKKEVKLGDDYRDFISPINADLYEDTFQKALKGESIAKEIRALPEGEPLWIEIKMSPIYNNSGDIVNISLYLKNINSQKKAEIELEEMAQNFKAIFDNVDESIFLLDKNYKVLNYNKYGFDRLKRNINKEVFIGADFKKFIYVGQEEVFIELFNKALSGSNVQKEIRVIAGDQEHWFLSKMFPVYDRNGDLLGISVSALNIHDRKIAEIALKESEAKFRSIVQAAPTPIIIVDKDRNIVLTNPETEHVFGFTSNELKNKNIQLLIPEKYSEDLIQYQNRFKENPEPCKMGEEGYISTKHKNGKEIFIEASLNHIQISEERQLLIILLDISERIEAEQKIVNQLKRLEAIAWEQSHEVRRPVANILGIINLFKTNQKLSEEDIKSYLDKLQIAGEDLDNVIHKIVNYTNDADEDGKRNN